MKTIKIIGSEFEGLWVLSSRDITNGFLFVKSIPFSEFTDFKKKETIKKEIFAEIALSNGKCLNAKMHVDVYSKLYEKFLESRNQGQKLTLPQTRLSLSAIPATLILGLIFVSFLQGEPTSDNTSELANDVPKTKLTATTQKSTSLPAIDQLFKQPYKYISTPVSRASGIFGVKENEGGNLIVDTPNHHILFEANNGLISYVDIEFNGTGPCSQTAGFDSEPLLRSLGIEPNSLELAKKQAHYHRYYDHTNRLKIGVTCSYDGANLSVGFSSKYYLQ